MRGKAFVFALTAAAIVTVSVVAGTPVAAETVLWTPEIIAI